MEAREPPPPSVSTGAGGNDGPANEDGPLSDAERLAKEAAVLFQSRHFSECIDTLNQLLQKKGDDPKVLHNIAVTEYFCDGCSDPGELLDVLNKVKKRSEDLARASVERMEVGSNISSSTTSGSKVNSTMLPQLSAPNTGTSVDDFDTSVVVLNIAVILYHLHEYALALSVLEPLYQNIEPIDEATALHVCLLLLDVALACQDASKAADVIQYLESSFGVRHMINQADTGSIAQHQSNQGSKVSATSNTTGPDASGSDYSGSANVSENSLTRTLSDDMLEFETLYSTLDTGSQILSRPVLNDCSNSSADRAASAIELKLNLHLYKVRLLLLTRNLKAAKREVKLAMNVARCRDSSTALVLKAQLEYARGNHRKAIKLLMMSSNRTEAGMLSMFSNNLGCIYHQLGKHNISTLSFCRALKSSMLLRPEKPLKLSTFSQDKSSVILYNCGLQYLACGKPLVAARCFNKARSFFFNRPLLWLRFAECCLSALDKGLLQPSSASSSGGEEVKVHVVGTGRWRQLVIDEKNPKYRCSNGPGEDGAISPDNHQFRLSLPFARQCLLNALYLLNDFEPTKSGASNFMKEDGGDQAISLGAKNSSHRNALSEDSEASNATSASAPADANGDSKEVKGCMSARSPLQSSVTAYEDTCKKVNNLVKQAVLGDLAYVELSLENPLKALAAAKALQQLPDCSRIYNFLNHAYAAEALCHLNRPKEAAEHLSVYISDKNEVQFPYGDEDRDIWRIEKGGEGEELNGHLNATTSLEPQGMVLLKPEEARGVLYVNLATMSIVQGNHEQASRFVKEALAALPNNPRAILAAIYVDLLLGRTQDALVKLKQCRHVRFFSGGVQLRSTC